MSKLKAMTASVKFNKPINKDKIFISPGSYEFIAGDKRMRFDFEDFSGTISKDDPTIVEIYHRHPDFGSFPEAESIDPDAMKNVTAIEEFYINLCPNGSDIDTDLRPVGLTDCSLYDTDDNEYVIDPSVLSKARMTYDYDE